MRHCLGVVSHRGHKPEQPNQVGVVWARCGCEVIFCRCRCRCRCCLWGSGGRQWIWYDQHEGWRAIYGRWGLNLEGEMTKHIQTHRKLYIHIQKMSNMSRQNFMNLIYSEHLSWILQICCHQFHCMPQDMQTTSFNKNGVLHDYFANVKGPHGCWDVDLATWPSWVGGIAVKDQETQLDWDGLQDDPQGNWSHVMAVREKGYSLCAVSVNIFRVQWCYSGSWCW